jgi:hypothetical protein
MMGADQGDQRGMVPRLCEDLFSRIRQQEVQGGGGWSAKVEVSYMEIYLEKVKDLLSADSGHSLRVRENISTGPYVENLSSHAVTDFDLVKTLMEDGNKVRVGGHGYWGWPQCFCFSIQLDAVSPPRPPLNSFNFSSRAVSHRLPTRCAPSRRRL